jgi:hypothetical protein
LCTAHKHIQKASKIVLGCPSCTQNDPWWSPDAKQCRGKDKGISGGKQRRGNLVALAWQCQGNAMAMHCLGIVMAMPFQLHGHVMAMQLQLDANAMGMQL